MRATAFPSSLAHSDVFLEGRAIRHKGDWAALVLLDRRYGGERIQGKLPRWIGDSVSVASTFGQAMKTLGTFYRERGTGTRSA